MKLVAEHVQSVTKVHVFDTNFYNKIENGDYTSVKTWTKKVLVMFFLFACNANRFLNCITFISVNFVDRHL